MRSLKLMWLITKHSSWEKSDPCEFCYNNIKNCKIHWAGQKVCSGFYIPSYGKTEHFVQSTGHSKHPLSTTQEKTTHGHHQMVNTEIILIIFFAAKDGEALYSPQKQDRELTVAQIMNSLLQNSNLN